MKSKEYISLPELAELHKASPGVFPVFSKIHKLNGVLVGEVKGYSDAYGNAISDSIKAKVYQ